jgi:hypothetical protein
MATITATKLGHWEDTTVWDLGRVPQDGDDVNISTYQVQITSSQIIPADGGTLNSITGTTGAIIFYSFDGQLILRATTIQAGANDSGIIQINYSDTDTIIYGNIYGSTTTTAAPGISYNKGHVTINGDIHGGTTSNSYGLGLASNSNVATIVINGDIYGGSTGGTYGISDANSVQTIRLFGNVYGGVAHGVSLIANCKYIQIGNVTGGTTTSTGYGIYNNGANSSVSVTGIVSGGDTRVNVGIFNNSTGNISIQGNLIYTLAPPITGLVTYNPSNYSYVQLNGEKFYVSSEQIGGAIIGGLGEWTF